MEILEIILSDIAIRKLEEGKTDEAVWVLEKLGEIAIPAMVRGGRIQSETLGREDFD